MERMKIWVALFTVAVSLTACQKIDRKQLRKDVKKAAAQAEKLQSKGKWRQAAFFVEAVRAIAPQNKRVKRVLASFTKRQRKFLKKRHWLGVNRSIRPKRKTSAGKLAIRWLPDRLRDLADCVTLSGSAGLQFGFLVQPTKYLGSGMFFGDTYHFGTYQKNLLATGRDRHNEISLLVAGPKDRGARRYGTGGHQSGTTRAFIAKPKQPIYQGYEDFYGLGGKFGYLIVGLEAYIHPFEVLDFALGIFMLDILKDDDGRHRQVLFTEKQRVLLDKVTGLSGKDIEYYRNPKKPKRPDRKRPREEPPTRNWEPPPEERSEEEIWRPATEGPKRPRGPKKPKKPKRPQKPNEDRPREDRR